MPFGFCCLRADMILLCVFNSRTKSFLSLSVTLQQPVSWISVTVAIQAMLLYRCTSILSHLGYGFESANQAENKKQRSLKKLTGGWQMFMTTYIGLFNHAACET